MLRRWVRAITAVIVLTALLVGVPWVLIRLAGWPLPTVVPDWELASRMARQGDIPAATVIKAIAVVVWFAWVQLAWAVLWELIVNVPRTVRGDRSRAAPLVSEPVAGGVGRLFAAIIAIGVLTATSAPASATRGALPTNASTPMAAVVDTTVHTREARPASPAASASVAWVVAGSDSLWSIAETSLGDGTRVDEVLELNAQLSPRHLQAGRTVLLPAGARVPADRVPPAAVAPAYANEDGDGSTLLVEVSSLPAETVVVADGDSLWELCEERLSAAGMATDPATVAEHVDRIAAANVERIVDPDLIYVGQQLVMPAIGEPVSTPAEAAASIPVVHLFVAGDTLWDVLERHHGHVDADMIWQVAADNGLAEQAAAKCRRAA